MFATYKLGILTRLHTTYVDVRHTTVLHHPACWNSVSVALTVVSALQPTETSLSLGSACAAQTDPSLWPVRRRGRLAYEV